MKLEKGQIVSIHTKKGRTLIDELPYFSLVQGGVKQWTVSAQGKYRNQRLQKDMSSDKLKYSKALEEGMALAKFYNMPLVNYFDFGKLKIVWAPEVDGELAKLRRARFFRMISAQQAGERKKRTKARKK
jgi:hypothetical protein